MKKRSYEIILALVITLWVLMLVSCTVDPVEEVEFIPEPEPDAPKIELIQAEPEEEIPEFEEVAPPDLGIDLSKFKQIENATLTHYCCCEICTGKTPLDSDYGITASGRPVEPYYSVAVDPYLIPLGSTVYIDYGDGELHECRADDTGRDVAGAHIDLYIPDHDEAWDLGRKTVKVYWKEGREDGFLQ